MYTDEDVCPECANRGTCSVRGRDIHVSCSCAAGFVGEECKQGQVYTLYMYSPLYK